MRHTILLTPVAVVVLAAAGPAVGQTLLLDDFDGDNADEFFGDVGLISVAVGTPPTVAEDTDFAAYGDVGAVRVVDADPDVTTLTVGQYPSDGNATLGLDAPAEGIIGFRVVFGDSLATDADGNDAGAWPFGITLTDDGPSSATRRSAIFDTLVPTGSGPFVVEARFDEPTFRFDDGFELFDLRQVAFGINVQNTFNSPFNNPVATLDVSVLEFSAILVPEPTATLALAGLPLLLRRRR